MDNLEKRMRFAIQNIVRKLENLECTLLGNKEDEWIMELLFKPGFHRCHLIEWMLSKLGYDIGKISGPQNSAEERMKYLQSAVSGLGLCQESNYDVIEGTATVRQQLKFWCTLIDIIWLKYQMVPNTSLTASDEGVELSLEKNKKNNIDVKFAEQTSKMTKICESVNLKHSFCKEIKNLVAPDVELEMKNLSPSKLELFKIPGLEELKENASKRSFIPKDLLKTLSTVPHIDLPKNDDTSDDELNQLEEQLNNVSQDLKNCEKQFNDVYNDLKSYIPHEETENFIDVGPAFKKLEQPLEKLMELKDSFAKLEYSNSKLSTASSDLDDLLNQEVLNDPMYKDILQLTKDES